VVAMSALGAMLMLARAAEQCFVRHTLALSLS
jgi:hypothetical protein